MYLKVDIEKYLKIINSNNVFQRIIDIKSKLDKLLLLVYQFGLTVLILIYSKWIVGGWPTVAFDLSALPPKAYTKP